MSAHHPRIRIRIHTGYVFLREGLSFSFYMRAPHDEVKQAVVRALDVYVRAVGPQALNLYTDNEGGGEKLDEGGWEVTRRMLLADFWAFIGLGGGAANEQQYCFEYFGRPLPGALPGEQWPDAVRAVSFWLPTEYLEEHGPGRVRELALEVASHLPFNSGHAGLSFNGGFNSMGMEAEVRQRCFRYPGLDIPDVERFSLDLGTRVRGPSWLTFLGQPVLGELGGAAGLRSRLHSPGTTVRELEGDRAVVTLGPWPEAGDTEQGNVLPAYRELARVLEPWLYHARPTPNFHFSPEDWRRWERRFLD